MSRILSLINSLRSSLWFVPTVIVTFSLALAVVCIEWSARVDPTRTFLWPRLYASGAEGARGTLESIGGSMITVAGVVFSITIAALSQASTQYTPRILRQFMRDRWNQVVLGVFLGIFTYCLVVLRSIRGGDEGLFVPSLAVIVALGLALVGIGFLIFFIHHVARSLQASTIVAAAAQETLSAVDHLFPEDVGAAVDEPEDPEHGTEPGRWEPIPSRRTGYIQSVDEKGLLRFACERDTIVRMERAIGDFVVKGQALAPCRPAWRTRTPPKPWTACTR